MGQAMKNFHVPLPVDLYEGLRDEAERSGEPATTLARQAIAELVKRLRQRSLHLEIAAYAAVAAGGAEDLDEELEAAGVELLQAEADRP